MLKENLIHKLGDVVLAVAERDEDSKPKEYVIGYISSIENVHGNRYYTVEWTNGLCCDTSYAENSINAYKMLLRQQLGKVN